MPDARSEAAAVLSVCAGLAEDARDARLVSAATDERARLERGLSRPPVIVAFGQTKAGKSSMVNALLGKPGISPVDARVATNAAVEFIAAAEPYARVHLAGEADREIDIDTLAEWVTEQGNAGNARGVQAVEVGLAVPLLQRVSLVDTPGAGADAEHLAMMLLSLKLADALLFVVDAQRELGASGLDFLRRAAERVGTVIIAVSKSDKYTANDQVLAANRRLLAEHAPKFAAAPMTLVSSRLAEAAAAATGALSEQLREESGLRELERLIHEHVVERAEALAATNALTHALTLLATLERRFAERHAAITATNGFRAGVDSELERLRAATEETTTWQRLIREGLDELRRRRLAAFEESIDRLNGEYGDRARRTRPDDAERLFRNLETDLTEAGARLFRSTHDGLPAIVAPALGAIDPGSPLDGTVTKLAQHGPAISIDVPTISPGGGASSGAGMLVGVSSGVLPHLIAAGQQALNLAIGFPIGPVVGAAVSVGGGLIRRNRANGAARELLDEAVRDETRQAARRIRDSYAEHADNLRAALEAYARDHASRRTAELEDLLRTQERAGHEAAAERARRAGEMDEGLVRTRRCAERADALLAGLVP